MLARKRKSVWTLDGRWTVEKFPGGCRTCSEHFLKAVRFCFCNMGATSKVARVKN